MINVKQEIEALLERLPEDCSFEDVQYHLYVLDKVKRGVEQLDRGEGVSQEEAGQRLKKWRSA